jgi:SAM-dependent methyltransferase
MNRCLLCGQNQCASLIDFGPQPICHHFFDGSKPETTHDLHLGLCGACGMTQLIHPIQPSQLTPHFDWIAYKEPEAHLDALVETLRGLPGITTQSVICGISFKEDSTRERLAKLGFHNSWRVDFQSDLDIRDDRAGMEMVQNRVRPGLEERLHAKHGAPDIVLVRHLLEHTHNPPAFMETLRRLVKPGGYVVFEVPDCARGFHVLDYTTLWEDHTLYLAEPTFLMCLRLGGFSIARFIRYQAAYENCLVAITRPGASPDAPSPSRTNTVEEKSRLAAFSRGFSDRRQAMRQLLQEWRRAGKIAVFGAGHQSVMFINLLGVADLIDFVVDDDPHKLGLRLPGSRLPIVASANLANGEVKLCLSSLSVESEIKVVQKLSRFFEEGGSFASIFPVRPETLLNFIARPGTLF